MPVTTLLIIDDDPFVREVTEMSFMAAGGWNVDAVATGMDGVERAKASPAPDAILLDFQMPDMDGPATVAALRADDATRGIPIVFITADGRSARSAAELATDGVVGVIAKPFDPMTLPDEVAAMLAAPVPEPVPDPQRAQEDALTAALAQLWERRRPETLATAAALQDELAADVDPARARELAHTLAGVLGSLGLYESSALARSIDALLGAARDHGVSSATRDRLLVLSERLGATLATEQPSG
jgi:CheY-like chemotaxis protein